MIGPVVTGVTWNKDIDAPVYVEDGPDVRWGWFAGGLNVRPAPSRESAYAHAVQAANRHARSVQIYAKRGNGWEQVDVVAKPDRELCEWWPERNAPASGIPGEGCQNTATLSVGKANNWHLCPGCRNLPSFRRMKVRSYLKGHYA